MSPVEALQLLVEAIDAQRRRSTTDLSVADSGFVKLDWIAPELVEARRVLEDRCESVVG